jgi:signal peptidase I
LSEDPHPTPPVVASLAAEPRSVRPADVDEEARERLRSDGGKGGKRSSIAELPMLVLAALVLAFLIKTFLVQAFYIPSGSMIPTLEIGDRVLVEKVTYRFREPQRGEVIVFSRPGYDPGPRSVGTVVRSFLEGLGLVQPNAEIDLIKRVIGLPGETVEIRKGRVLINGEPLDESYAQPETRDYGPTEVPADHLFMLGDNRMNSDDSRFSLGTVPLSNVVGKAFVILWPPASATLSLDQDYPGVGETPAGPSPEQPTQF